MGVTYPVTITPTFAGFQNWIYNIVGFPATAIPADAEILTWAYNTAVSSVNTQIGQIPGPLYAQAIYNFGTDWLVDWAPDVPGQYYPSPPAPPPSTAAAPTANTGYFAWLRANYNIFGFLPGIVSSSFDQGTGQSLTPLEQYKNYTLGNLQQTKTPWGRAYLAIAASVGTLWGIT